MSYHGESRNPLPATKKRDYTLLQNTPHNIITMSQSTASKTSSAAKSILSPLASSFGATTIHGRLIEDGSFAVEIACLCAIIAISMRTMYGLLLKCFGIIAMIFPAGCDSAKKTVIQPWMRCYLLLQPQM